MRPILLRLLLLLCSLGAVALLAEIALRAALGPPVRFLHPQESYVWDPEIGHRLEPGIRAYTHDEPVEINEKGLRAANVSGPVPAGTRRVLALGDSQTFGNGLSLEETWPALLEDRLRRESPGWRWQVLNAGIPGSNTWQHALLLERLADQYEFHAVALGFFVNDVSGGRVVAQQPERTTPLVKRLGYLLKRSALFSFLWQSRRRITATRGEDDDVSRMLKGIADPEIEAGWQQVESSLEDMKSSCERLGVRFLLVAIPRNSQVRGEEPSRVYNRRIAEVASRLGIPIADTLEPLLEAWDELGEELFIPWDGHNTAAANAVIADVIADSFGPDLAP